MIWRTTRGLRTARPHLRLILLVVSVWCTSDRSDGQVLLDTLTWTDSVRHRTVPVAFYHVDRDTKGLPVVLFSHGYNENRPGAYLRYSHLARAMALSGWFVVSVQHELPTDERLPLEGVAQVVRRPSWERGVANLLFVLDRLRRSRPDLNLERLTVMGHSQGGDISMLFAKEHPDLLERVISLDNRRMPLPRTHRPQVCSIRSSDQPADQGVLPGAEEAHDLDMRVLMSTVPHNAMDDGASPEQRKELTELITRLLNSEASAR
ncbi:MAG: alpha/beta fold hydrolase [Flavobacteriales bacterium]|nr:alpha/beta fold hydrolase [Flavobacteriales bacterium]